MFDELQKVAFESSKSNDRQKEEMDEQFTYLRAKLLLILNEESETFKRYQEMLLKMSSKKWKTQMKRKKNSSSTDKIDLKEKSIGQITQIQKSSYGKG